MTIVNIFGDSCHVPQTPFSSPTSSVSSTTHCGKPDLIFDEMMQPQPALCPQVSSQGRSELARADKGVAVSECVCEDHFSWEFYSCYYSLGLIASPLVEVESSNWAI